MALSASATASSLLATRRSGLCALIGCIAFGTITIVAATPAASVSAPSASPLSAVGYLFGPFPAGVRCSAVLIGPRVIVTAAHCLVKGSRTTLLFTTRDEIASATGIAEDNTMARAVKWLVDPDYRPLDPSSLHDIGVALLDRNIVGSTRLDTAISARHIFQPRIGDHLVVAGYGAHGVPRGSTVKHLRVRAITELSAMAIVTNAVVGPQDCYGDSGGPVLWTDDRGRAQIVGVVSRSADPLDVSCKGPSVNSRIDTASQWLAPAIAELGATP